MASTLVSADTLVGLTSRYSIPTLRSPRTSRTLRYSTSSSFNQRLVSKSPNQSFTVFAATPPQNEGSSDVLTQNSPDTPIPIPVTVITGFLGSGKTTLLNHILSANPGKRIAVIENEYGEINIDGSLVAAKTDGEDEIFMLTGGCLSGSMRGDLIRILTELVSKQKGNKFDHIVIETTGLANPAPLIETFFYSKDEVFSHVKLDGVVTVVDAKQAPLDLDTDQAIEQIAYADRIIMNKTDLVGEPDVASLMQQIRNINGMAQLMRTEFGKINLDFVLGIGGFDLERIGSAIDAEGEKQVHDHNREYHNGHHAHDHVPNPGVSSVSIFCEGNFDLEKVDTWLSSLLEDRGGSIYRMKGLLSIQGMNERYVFQGVHDIFRGKPDRLWRSNESRTNKIVFIGNNLDAQELEKDFKSCLLKDGRNFWGWFSQPQLALLVQEPASGLGLGRPNVGEKLPRDDNVPPAA